MHEGDTVEAGQPLFELDPRPFEHKVAMLEAKLVETQYHIKQLQAQLAAAKAEQRQLAAEAEYARVVYRQEQEIFERQSTTERKYVDAVQKLKAAEAALERSASLVENVEQALAAQHRHGACIGGPGEGRTGRSRIEPWLTRRSSPRAAASSPICN